MNHKKMALSLIAGTCLSFLNIGYAAENQLVWGKLTNVSQLFKNFAIIQKPSSTDPKNTLRYSTDFVDEAQNDHVRYAQYYQGLPVLGKQLVFHSAHQKNTTVTGSILNNIEQDIPSIDAKLTIEQAKQLAIGSTVLYSNVNAEKIIYFNQVISAKAILAYHVSFLNQTSAGPSIDSFIIDANTGTIIKKWNALPTLEQGQGIGGIERWRYQFGNVLPNMNSFGYLDVTPDNIGNCMISNDLFRVINLKNIATEGLPFSLPMTYLAERDNNIHPFLYLCDANNFYDNGYAPVNGGVSPINDAAYFVKQTFNMLTTQYGIEAPIGTHLPLRVVTHLANYDNAYACGTNCMLDNLIAGPQQIVLGNGGSQFSPLTSGDIVAHEFAHLVTDHFSNLAYVDQPGGINEAFSDITGIAFKHYLSKTRNFSWYWDEIPYSNWTIGAEVTKSGRPLRYFENPPLDGQSIDNFKRYKNGMANDTTSGVYNRLFFLLAMSPDWSIEKAYQVFLDANRKHWGPGTSFQEGACGIETEIYTRKYPVAPFQTAIRVVGLEDCVQSKDAVLE